MRVYKAESPITNIAVIGGRADYVIFATQCLPNLHVWKKTPGPVNIEKMNDTDIDNYYGNVSHTR